LVTLAAMGFGDVSADNRPYRRVIDSPHYL
jgi:hypothetical protein